MRTLNPTNRNARTKIELIRQSIYSILDSCRCALEEEYGWTVVDVDFKADTLLQKLVFSGCVLVPSIMQRLYQSIRRQISWDWEVCFDEVREVRTGCWHSLAPGITRVWREFPKEGLAPTLSTEFQQQDGPVEMITRLADAWLVRGTDGTVGWITQLGGSVSPPKISRTFGLGKRGLLPLIREYLDTPYLLGGTTKAGIDCSGFSQRVYRDALGMVIPRHSTDQLHWSGASTKATASNCGDLVFTQASIEGSSHVGIFVRSGTGEASVIHASRSRGRVVEDGFNEYLATASQVAIVPIEYMIERYASMANRATILMGQNGLGRSLRTG